MQPATYSIADVDNFTLINTIQGIYDVCGTSHSGAIHHDQRFIQMLTEQLN